MRIPQNPLPIKWEPFINRDITINGWCPFRKKVSGAFSEAYNAPVRARVKGKRIRGHLLTPTAGGKWVDRPDATLEIGPDGRILKIHSRTGNVDEDWRPHILLPGFIDTHAHVPQHSMCGVHADKLLPWLEKWVFPLEAKFRGEGADVFYRECLRNGTTSGAFYSSAWPESADACRRAMTRLGMSGWVGMPLMDLQVYRPDLKKLSLRKRTAKVIRELEEDTRRDGTIRSAVTPRFALSCSDELLEAAGSFDLPVQTHISENPDEIRAVKKRGKDYLQIYERAGLVHDSSILAHGVWLSRSEWNRIRKSGATVAHCPGANLFLQSGVMDWREGKGGIVSLGTDVGAGPSHSLYDVMRTAWSVHHGTPSARILLEMATLEGARAIEEPVGSLQPGFRADIQVVDRDRVLAGKSDSLDDLLSRIVHRGGAHAIRAIYTGGVRRRA